MRLCMPEGSSLREVIQEIKMKFPNISCEADRVVAAINEEYSDHDQIVSHGDTVALIPPVSGGK